MHFFTCRLLTAALLALSLPGPSHAVTFEFTIDRLTEGKAVLQGSLLDLEFMGEPAPGAILQRSFSATYPANDDSMDWSALALISKRFTQVGGSLISDFSIAVSARHISDPPPHPELGEASPGPFLGTVLWRDIRSSEPPSLVQMVAQRHDSDHRDIMTAELLDLAPFFDGVLGGPNGEVRVIVDLIHTPLPPAGALLIPAVLALAVMRRRARACARAP